MGDKCVRAELKYDTKTGCFDYEVHDYRVSESARRRIMEKIEELNRLAREYSLICQAELIHAFIKILISMGCIALLYALVPLANFDLLFPAITLVIVLMWLSFFWYRRSQFQKEFNHYVMLVQLELVMELRSDIAKSGGKLGQS